MPARTPCASLPIVPAEPAPARISITSELRPPPVVDRPRLAARRLHYGGRSRSKISTREPRVWRTRTPPPATLEQPTARPLWISKKRRIREGDTTSDGSPPANGCAIQLASQQLAHTTST